jgi:Holliday junction resolvasome RuvABC DNA-binding subunit
MDGHIDGITVRRTAESIRAEAEVTLAGVGRTITSVGRSTSPDSELLELRRQLYALGFSKRAISTAVKTMKREAGGL